MIRIGQANLGQIPTRVHCSLPGIVCTWQTFKTSSSESQARIATGSDGDDPPGRRRAGALPLGAVFIMLMGTSVTCFSSHFQRDRSSCQGE